jgi:hypothetical protein
MESSTRKRQDIVIQQAIRFIFFSWDNYLVCCINVDCLMEAPDRQHDPDEWRLPIDSSKLSLKAVLLKNGYAFQFS